MNNEETLNNEKIGNTILETKIASTKSECENITKKWEKPCPRCNGIQTYSNKWKLQRAIKSGSQCSKCCNAVVLDQDFYYRDCPQCGRQIKHKDKYGFYSGKRKNLKCARCRHLGIKMSESAKKKLSDLAKERGGHPHTEQHKQKIKGRGNPMYGVHRYDELNPFYGKQHDAKSRRKMRVAACKRVLELQRSSDGRINNIGRKEDAYFAKMEAERGWNGVYYGKSGKQFLVEDLGYFVDYYEPTLNIVVEYDEPRHYRQGALKEQDMKRMGEIQSHLGCEFWRYDEYQGVLRSFVKRVDR